MTMKKEDILAAAQASISPITANDAEALLASGAIVLDVREPAE